MKKIVFLIVFFAMTYSSFCISWINIIYHYGTEQVQPGPDYVCDEPWPPVCWVEVNCPLPTGKASYSPNSHFGYINIGPNVTKTNQDGSITTHILQTPQQLKFKQVL